MKFSLSETDIEIAPRSPVTQRSEPIRTNGLAPTAVGDVVQAIAPYLTADLIAPDHLAHLKTIADQLPDTLTNYFGFECRLGEVAPLADILFCVRQIMYQPTVLAGLMPGIPEQWPQQEVVWQQACQFGQAWADPTSTLFRKVQDIWLEFDVAGPPDPIPIPSLFFGSKVIHSRFAPEAHGWISKDAVRLLTGRPLTDSLQHALLNCITALPDDALLFQMGAMLSREPAFVRICVSRLTPDNVLPYLASIGWEGEQARLAALIRELATFMDTVSLDIDLIEGGIGSKIGLECAPKNEKVIDNWFAFLDYLVEQGFCLPDKHAGLLAYVAPDKQPSTVTRGLHHIKLVLQNDKPIEAKAYLSVVSELA